MRQLKIQTITTQAIRVPLPRLYRGSMYSMSNRCTIITRVFTDAGLVGEIYTGDSDEQQRDLQHIIEDELAPLLVGKDAFNIAGCWEAMKPLTYDILRDRNLVMQAISAVDAALWDVIGKALEMPLYRLWGGFTDRLPIIAIGGYYGQSDEELAQEIRDYLGYQVSGMKFKIGGASPNEDLRRLKIAIDAAGDNFRFMVDANQGYELRDAVTFVQMAQAEGIQLEWFEEPVKWYNDQRWLKDVRLMTSIPVTAGQSAFSLPAVRDLIAGGSVDICNFDASWDGGPSIWRKAAEVAYAYGVKMAHHEEAQVAAHLLASIPHGTYVECFHKDRDPVFWKIQTTPPPIADGVYHVPNLPGFGLQLNQDFLDQYAV